MLIVPPSRPVNPPRSVVHLPDLAPRRDDFPASEDKIYDVVGLYLNPPDNAVVLSVDEKTQIQALSRTQPLLPLRSGLTARRAHDYRRNGLTSLYAALQVATGTVMGECSARHTGSAVQGGSGFAGSIERSWSLPEGQHLWKNRAAASNDR